MTRWQPLDSARIYRLSQRLVMSSKRLRWYAATYLHPRPGDRVLDIGCGPADILDYLPDVDYTGFDPSDRYIAWATARHGAHGRFFRQMVSPELLLDLGAFDLIIANGVLHHLDDAQARALFKLAQGAMTAGARLVTFDGCYAERQHPLAAYLASRDRGRFVRSSAAYEELARERFPAVSAHVHHDLLRVPYSHVILECSCETSHN